jgi:hypothetical protein
MPKKSNCEEAAKREESLVGSGTFEKPVRVEEGMGKSVLRGRTMKDQED